MEKTAKYYLCAEVAVLLTIMLSGLYDKSFRFWGTYFVGTAISIFGLGLSLFWVIKSKRSSKVQGVPVAMLLVNILLLLSFILFILCIFSAGIHLMV